MSREPTSIALGDSGTWSYSLAASANSATKLVFTTEPGGGPGGTAWTEQPVVAIEDGDGNVATADTNPVTISLASNPNGGTISGCTSTTIGGVASFSACRIDVVGGGYTLTANDAADALTSSPSDALAITVGAPSQLVFTNQPGGGTGGTAWTQPAVVAIEDAGGNVVTADSNAITLFIANNPGGGTLAGCSATTLSRGRHLLRLVTDRSRRQRLQPHRRRRRRRNERVISAAFATPPSAWAPNSCSAHNPAAARRRPRGSRSRS